ncbi:unnamed protein product, partial [Urochloa humidicola]
ATTSPNGQRIAEVNRPRFHHILPLFAPVRLRRVCCRVSPASMAAVVRGVLRGIKEKGLANFFREIREEGYLNALLDGNLMQTKIHNIGATLVGVDKFGNKYYEKLHDTQYGRHRWVEYAEKSRYNASQVPPEWHGWLHHITDNTGDQLLAQKTARYLVEHKQNYSGEGEELIYHSKGHALNPGQRDWTRYQPWEPKKELAE